jgi:hypothetical protein
VGGLWISSPCAAADIWNKLWVFFFKGLCTACGHPGQGEYSPVFMMYVIDLDE